MKVGVRDIGMVKRTLEEGRCRGRVMLKGGMGVKATDNVTPASVCQHNSVIIFARRCVCRCAYFFLC